VIGDENEGGDCDEVMCHDVSVATLASPQFSLY